MTNQSFPHVFLSYNEENRDSVESLARRLEGDARLSFWFAPWHSVPGVPIQEQMEVALQQASSCAVFIGSVPIQSWQTEQMRTAIQRRVEEVLDYRVIPVLLPDVTHPKRHDLPPFLRRYEPVEFRSLDDEQAFKRLLAGIMGIPPVQVEGFIQTQTVKARLPTPSSGKFAQGHSLVIGVANYRRVRQLPTTVLNDACDVHTLLTDPVRCGYPQSNAVQLLDSAATGQAIRAALAELASRAGPNDTAVVFFSGHGAHDILSDNIRQYILPFDCDLADLPSTAIVGEEMTKLLHSIKVARLLVLFDSCHSGGVGDPKGSLPQIKSGLSEDYYQVLANGKGRVVIASSRTDEVSWVLPGMSNSLFTHYLLEALHGQCRTLGDGYVRVFDIFRHVAENVPVRAEQHPVFKATAMEDDFPVALVKR